MSIGWQSIPATSASSERVFSVAGLAIGGYILIMSSCLVFQKRELEISEIITSVLPPLEACCRLKKKENC